MQPYWIGSNCVVTLTLYRADATDLLPQLDPVDVIITDPVWPGVSPDVQLPGSADPYALWARAAAEFPRLCSRLIVILGQRVDPRFLGSVPSELPFLRACWLRYIKPRYRGTVLDGADLAYVFGGGWLPGDGTRLLPGECVCTRVECGTPDYALRHHHPTPRNLEHVEWLVAHYTRPGQTILDPFCGSGTTLVAAAKLGRHAIGIEIDEEFAAVARRRCELALAQRAMPFE